MIFTNGVTHPGTSGRLERDRASERMITDEIARTLSADTAAINQLAERRADAGGASEYGAGFPLLTRNLEREGLEELADCRNYIVWRLQSLLWDLVEDDGRIPHLQNALRYVVLGFEELRAAER